MSSLITVSNGSEFYQVDPSQLEAVRESGFYRPAEKQRTIVSDGREALEIHRRDLRAALRDGYRDVLAKELKKYPLQPVVSKQAAVNVIPDTASEASSATNAARSSTPKVPAEKTPAESGDSSSPALPATAAAPPSVVEQFEQAETELQEEMEHLQAEVDESQGFRKWMARLRLWWVQYGSRAMQQARGTGVSIALHVGVLLLLASCLLVTKQKEPAVLVVSSHVDEVIEEEFIEPVELEVDEPIEEVEPVSDQPDVVSEVTETLVATDFMESITGNLLSAPEAGGAPSEGDGEMSKPMKAKVKFFGSKTEAIDFVFVIDNSNSMTQGRFETALNELVKAVLQLNAKQKFYVIFYSDTAYPLFHPYGAKTLVPATPRNKQALIQWLKTVQLCLKTNGREALELGFSLKPDVMFVLGDGAFTDKAALFYASNPVKGVVVHSLGMEVNASKAKGFEALAKAHKGTYRDVGVHPAGALLAKQAPRKKNNSNNGIWGLKLPRGKNK